MSVIKMGSFGAKRRLEQEAELACVGSMPYVNKRFRLNEHRDRITPPRDDNMAYVEVGETSSTGAGILSIERITDAAQSGESWDSNALAVFEYGQIKVLPNDEHLTQYAHFRGTDLRDLRLSLKCKNDVSNPEVVFWDDSATEVMKRNVLLAKRKYKGWLRKTTSFEPVGEIRSRVFTSSVMKCSGGVRGFIRKVNKRLDSELTSVMKDIMRDPRISMFKTETVGQMIISFMLRGNHLSNSEGNFKTRLMLLFLETMVFGYESRSDAVLYAGLFTWLVLDGCDSCFEKILFTGLNSDAPYKFEYPYSMDSYAFDEGRYLSIAPGSRLDYEIGGHPTEVVVQNDCSVWRTWDHSFIRPRYVHGVIKFSLASRSGNGIEIPIRQHWGMSLMTCLDGLHKGLKRATFGGGNSGLIDWAGQSGSVVGADFSRINGMLVDLTLIYESYPLLTVFAENVLGYLILCVIPCDLASECLRKAQTGNQEGIDFYDLLVRHCFSRRSNINSELMQSLVSIPAIDDRLKRLQSEDIKMTMVHYQNEPLQ